LAVKAALAVGLRMAGVDIIQAKRGPLLLEINACPGFEALEAVSGINVAGKLLDLLASQK
jgi:ribosomal protein S6--L-glutamate ligase